MPRAIALDPGTRRIGVAAGDPLGITARPLPFIATEPEEEALRRIAEVAAEREAETVVVGLPLNMDGSEGPAAEGARAFGEKVRAALPGVEVILWDERLTTDDAERHLIEKGLSHRERKRVIDSLSAAMLLKSWLDEQKREAPADESPPPLPPLE